MISLNTRLRAVIAVVALASENCCAAPLVPPGLNAGDSYYLAFVTEGIRNATSPNISDYNGFVQNESQRSGAITANYGIAWLAVASTESVQARTNLGIQVGDTSPVFLLNGTKIAVGGTDFWDGDLLAALWVTQFGLLHHELVWTGTAFDIAAEGVLGTISPIYGQAGDFNSQWLVVGRKQNSDLQSFYAVSERLTVPSAPATVPEPSTFVVWSILGIVTSAGWLSLKEPGLSTGFSAHGERGWVGVVLSLVCL